MARRQLVRLMFVIKLHKNDLLLPELFSVIPSSLRYAQV